MVPVVPKCEEDDEVSIVPWRRPSARRTENMFSHCKNKTALLGNYFFASFLVPNWPTEQYRWGPRRYQLEFRISVLKRMGSKLLHAN